MEKKGEENSFTVDFDLLPVLEGDECSHESGDAKAIETQCRDRGSIGKAQRKSRA